jgi:hypothetical protein
VTSTSQRAVLKNSRQQIFFVRTQFPNIWLQFECLRCI